MRRACTLIFLTFALPAIASEPFRVIANVFSVGASDATVFIIATPKGLVLLDSGRASEYDKIRANMKKLGFDYYDIRIMLLSHANADHAGNLARIRRETGARLMVADADIPLLQHGGSFAAVDVDQSLRAGDRVAIGGLILDAHITPGETKGCTTWTTQVRWARKPYDVIFVGCRPDHPDALRALKPDVFLGSHAAFFDLERKWARRAEDPNPFIDPAGYRKFIDESARR
jgi:metallo-beta-lactamase class B